MFVHECLSDSLSFRLVQLHVEIKTYKLKLKRLKHVQSDSGKGNAIIKLKKQKQNEKTTTTQQQQNNRGC